ncbi:MAG: efflux RND transporter periplasmic adaptor subunit [Stellaceae bacterium]
MKRLLVVAAVGWLCLSRFVAPLAAAAGDGTPSVLVQLTKLRRGSLPQIVTAYGQVRADSSARLMVMAPLAAVVDQIYVRLGEEVAKGAPLVGLGPSPQAAAAYAQARSAVKVADDLVQRTRTMLSQHLATGQDLANAEKSAADAQAALAALVAQGAGGAQTLRAPFHAIVTALSTSPGAIVAQGAALIELARPNALVLNVGVIPAQAIAIKPGDAASVIPLGARDPTAAKVVLRGAAVDPQTGLLPIEIALPAGPFLPGEMASADIVTAQVPGYVVPHAAILVNRRGSTYVVQAVLGAAKKVAVRVLAADNGEDVVAGPLDPSAPVVLDGNYQLENGMRIRVQGSNGSTAK